MFKRLVSAWNAGWGERGQVLIIVAGGMIAFLAVCAFVIDASRLFIEKSHDQNAADAASLAGARWALDDSGTLQCGPDSPCRRAVEEYLGYNHGPTVLCTASRTTDCYELLVPYKDKMVKVIVHTDISPYFANLVGLGGPFHVTASAAATVNPLYGVSTVSTTGTTQTLTTGTTTVIEGQFQTAIFARAQICSSFFIPGHDTHVSGVSVFGGIGNIGTGSVVDAVRMNYDFYPGQSENCSYPGAPMVPVPPEFWNHDGNGNPVGGTGPDDWPVPFPDRAALFRSSDAHCLYTNAAVAKKQLDAGGATITMAQADCLKTGDTVTISGVDSVFNGTYTITGTPSANSFTYAKTRTPFTRTVSKKAMDGGVATLTTTAVHGLVVGDIVNISGVSVTGGIDFNGGPFVVTAVPSTTTFSYQTAQTQNLSVTNKALASGVATLTTAVQHHLSVGDEVVVDINDSRFDGTYQVTAVPSNTTFRYIPAPAAPVDVAAKSISSGIAKLTTAADHNLKVGDTVTVAVGDPRFDGTFAVSSVPSNTTFTYTAPVVAVKSYSVTSNVATLTATSPPHGLNVGDSVTVNFTGAGAPTYLNGTFTVTAVTSSTFSYAVSHNNVATTNKNTNVTIATVAPDNATGTATLVSIASTPTTGTVAVGPFLAAVASGGTVSATGNVASTKTGGTVTSGSTANDTLGTGWQASHPPGIYIVDAGNGVALTISESNKTYNGYTFVAPEILVSGSQDTFTKFSSAAQDALFYAYNPSGDAVHVNGNTTGNVFNGGMFCGPPERTGTSDPTNKCWFGGDGTTFNGLMEAWHIEYTATHATFNGTGPPIGPGTTTSTTYSTTVITTPGSTTTVTTPTATGATVGLGE
jgi:hypothetical protein